jgi:hypothetical protein
MELDLFQKKKKVRRTLNDIDSLDLFTKEASSKFSEVGGGLYRRKSSEYLLLRRTC